MSVKYPNSQQAVFTETDECGLLQKVLGPWPASSQLPLAQGGKLQIKDFQGHCIAEVGSYLLSRPQLQQAELMYDSRTNLRLQGM